MILLAATIDFLNTCLWLTGMQGPVRRIHFAPAAASELTHNLSIPSAQPVTPPHTTRVAALFSTGAFAVWELPPSYELRPVSLVFVSAEERDCA